MGISQVFAQAPLVQTERLCLRAHCPADLPACASMWADPQVVRHIGGKTSTEQEVWFRMLRYAGHWSFLGFGYWAVEEQTTGKFVGEIGFADFKRKIDGIDGLPEAGWAFATAAQGKGYASEALRAVLTWAAATFAWPRTACIIQPQNVASIRVAEKCGYREFQRPIVSGETMILFSRSLP